MIFWNPHPAIKKGKKKTNTKHQILLTCVQQLHWFSFWLKLQQKEVGSVPKPARLVPQTSYKTEPTRSFIKSLFIQSWTQTKPPPLHCMSSWAFIHSWCQPYVNNTFILIVHSKEWLIISSSNYHTITATQTHTCT